MKHILYNMFELKNIYMAHVVKIRHFEIGLGFPFLNFSSVPTVIHFHLCLFPNSCVLFSFCVCLIKLIWESRAENY